MSCPRRPPASGATFLGTNHRDPNWLRAERRGCSSARALLIVLAPLTEGGAFSLKSFSISKQPPLVLVHTILILLPGCTCPASAGLSSSAEPKSRRPGLPWCGRKTFRAKCLSVPLSPASWRGRGFGHHSGLNF